MPLTKCARCKQLFKKVNASVCPKCTTDEEADFEKVREYLETHPNETAEQVSEGSAVTVECVLRLLESGRIVTAPTVGVRCGRCGAPAISMAKKLCEACLQKLNAEVAQAQAKILLPQKRPVEVGTAMNVRKWVESGKK